LLAHLNQQRYEAALYAIHLIKTLPRDDLPLLLDYSHGQHAVQLGIPGYSLRWHPPNVFTSVLDYLDIAHPDTTPERKERNLRIIKDILAKPTRNGWSQHRIRS